MAHCAKAVVSINANAHYRINDLEDGNSSSRNRSFATVRKGARLAGVFRARSGQFPGVGAAAERHASSNPQGPQLFRPLWETGARVQRSKVTGGATPDTRAEPAVANGADWDGAPGQGYPRIRGLRATGLSHRGSVRF